MNDPMTYVMTQIWQGLLLEQERNRWSASTPQSGEAHVLEGWWYPAVPGQPLSST